MAKLHVPDDLREFLKLLNSKRVEYLLVGGYAVSFHGYPRATADMDIWVAISPRNADKLLAVLRTLTTSPISAIDRLTECDTSPTASAPPFA